MEKLKDKIETDPHPSPLAPRECKCGCGHSFTPTRKDKVYLNNQHANFGYNHGKRKRKNDREQKVQCILHKNDRILQKYFESIRGKEVVCYLDVLIADGFDPAYYIATQPFQNKQLFYSYNFGFVIYNENEHLLIKILKR